MSFITETVQKKNFRFPDEIDEFMKLKQEVVDMGTFTITKVTLQPGWRWSTHSRLKNQTELCESEHVGYCVSGRLHLTMGDGSEEDVVPEDIIRIPSGHDAWVVGTEPFVFLEFSDGSPLGK